MRSAYTDVHVPLSLNAQREKTHCDVAELNQECEISDVGGMRVAGWSMRGTE